MRDDIPEQISDEEIIVRAILEPLQYKLDENKLNSPSFLPPPDSTDVSVNRHQYCGSDFCKNHGKSLSSAKNTYCGLAIIKAKSIKEANEETIKQLAAQKTSKGVSISLESSPLANNGSHADIRYLYKFEDDEPKTEMRKFAKNLIKKAKYFHDPEPNTENWKGDSIDDNSFI